MQETKLIKHGELQKKIISTISKSSSVAEQNVYLGTD